MVRLPTRGTTCDMEQAISHLVRFSAYTLGGEASE